MKRVLFFTFVFFVASAVFSQTYSDVPDVLTVIHSRKSVRKFTEQQVSREQLETLVKAGMAAPTAVNKQPWAFIAIDDREILDQLAEQLGGNKNLMNACAAIVVCGDLQKAVESLPDYWVQDCSAATQNILLAADRKSVV